ncbi:helix-turn-helix domain-containing protein [Streptomyces sp. NPDC046831]|uniref:helix-turn-helix domain-containing protein n=1 Tax=Streptomyces sp. NPDC046831 TaxID=3154805 RepID=UPI0033CD08BA
MASLNVGNLGEYLREQRRNAQLSLRQLADAAGVSNPYLSQIERGLRKPSAEVLQQVAKALRISAETLYVRAGILDAERDREEWQRDGATRAAVLADPTLNERQKQVLLQIYESFRKENGFRITSADGGDDVSQQDDASSRRPDGTRERSAGAADAPAPGATDEPQDGGAPGPRTAGAGDGIRPSAETHGGPGAARHTRTSGSDAGSRRAG